jgi:hypothetical protein
VLIGSSHPRDFSLADLTLPVAKILGSRDCVAEVEKSDTNRHLLPALTRWVVVDGANHSQFGWYGFQPGDCWATIDRARQHAVTVEAVIDVLVEAERRARAESNYLLAAPTRRRPQRPARRIRRREGASRRCLPGTGAKLVNDWLI